MSTTDKALDEALAQQRRALDRQTAPPALHRRLVQQLPRKRRWWPLPPYAGIGLAAGIGMAVLGAFLWQGSLPPEAPAAVPENSFTVVRQQVPVRTFSVRTGPATRMVDATIVRDGRGLAHAVYLHQANPSL